MKKKVYIICGKEQYSTIWENLPEIINIEEEELIFPYEFIDHKKIDEKIEQDIINYLKEFSDNEDAVRLRFTTNWFERKFTHFKKHIAIADTIILTRHFKLSKLDSQELFKELEYCENLKDKKFCIIDMEQLTHQKTI